MRAAGRSRSASTPTSSLRLGRRHYDRAIADFNEAIWLDPNNANAFHNRGVSYSIKGDNDRAIADFNEAIRLNPNDALFFCHRGVAKEKISKGSGNRDILTARELDVSSCR
jgi:tetratricopeptide (TPR) repeat protein